MSPDELSKLIVRVAVRDRVAFDEVYRRTSAKLYGVCARILHDPSEAEDALQDVYVKIWQRANRYTETELSPITWLVAIARNHSIDVLRARKRTENHVEQPNGIAASTDADPETRIMLSSDLEALNRCLDELEIHKASAVRSAYLHGHTYQELALRHGVPLNTMRTWLRRSLISLRNCLKQ